MDCAESIRAGPDPGFAPVKPAAKSLVTRVVCDRLRIGLVAPYVAGGAAVMREAGLTWFAPRRLWVCEARGFDRVLEALNQGLPQLPGYTLDGLRDLAELAWRHPAPDFFTEVLDLQLMPLRGGGVALCGAFDPVVARAMRGLEGRFHRASRVWELRRPREAVLRALKDLAGVDEAYVFEHEAAGVLEDLASGGGSAIALQVSGAAPAAGAPDLEGASVGSAFLSAIGEPCKRLAVDEAVLAAAGRTCGLRDYQIAGVRHLLSHSSALLADDMGVGKTRQAIVAAYLAAAGKAVLVVCPASLGINWEREIRAVLPQALVAIVGRERGAELRQAQWIIANYERLGGLVRDAALELSVMLVDEAHYLKEPQAGRTRNAFVLAQRVDRVFLLTGTPVLNREVELHTLLRLSGHPLGALALAEFRQAYAGDAMRRQALSERIAEWMLRRGKDVLTDLGTKTHQLRYISPPDELAQYRAILADSTLDAMPKLTLLRQHLESLKHEFLIESIQGLGQGDKALIFCEFVDSVGALAQALQALGIACVTLTGADTPAKRMAAVDGFQQRAEVRVFIGATMAAGVGLTLTAANVVFFASLPWTPALKRQAEDRAYRSGNRRDVLVIVPVVAHTIDEQIAALLDSKRDIEASIVEVNRRRVG